MVKWKQEMENLTSRTRSRIPRILITGCLCTHFPIDPRLIMMMLIRLLNCLRVVRLRSELKLINLGLSLWKEVMWMIGRRRLTRMLRKMGNLRLSCSFSKSMRKNCMQSLRGSWLKSWRFQVKLWEEEHSRTLNLPETCQLPQRSSYKWTPSWACHCGRSLNPSRHLVSRTSCTAVFQSAKALTVSR